MIHTSESVPAGHRSAILDGSQIAIKTAGLWRHAEQTNTLKAEQNTQSRTNILYTILYRYTHTQGHRRLLNQWRCHLFIVKLQPSLPGSPAWFVILPQLSARLCVRFVREATLSLPAVWFVLEQRCNSLIPPYHSQGLKGLMAGSFCISSLTAPSLARCAQWC